VRTPTRCSASRVTRGCEELGPVSVPKRHVALTNSCRESTNLERGDPMVRTKLFRVALFLIAGSVLSAAPSAALARAQKTALSGDQFATVSGPPGSVQHAGKWTIFTNAPLAGTFEFTGDGVSLAGTLTRLV